MQKLLLILIIFTTVLASCRQRPLPVDVERFTITIPADSAVILETKTIVEKQTSTEADFAYYNLPISAPFKSFVKEKAVNVNGLMITNEIFEGIKTKSGMYKLINEKVSEGDGETLNLNENTAPYNLKYRFIHVNTKQDRDCIMRIENYKPGEQQNLIATIIIGNKF
jgi:hypothetical protein